MSYRRNAAFVAAATVSALAAPGWGQHIDYESGEYEYPAEPSSEETDTVAAETMPEDPPPLPAVRVIPMRQAGPPPVFVSNPVVQGAGSGPVTVAAPIAAPVPTRIVQPAAPALHAYPVGSAAQVATGSNVIYAQPAQITLVRPLPPGAQVVQFDAASWLADCRERLDAYHPDDREAVIASLGTVALDYAPGGDYCSAYLDAYMASAAAGTLAAPHRYGQQYMLIATPGR